MTTPTIIKLQDGNVMPQLGTGVWKASNEEVITAIHKALEVGYRSIDTAAAYKMKKVSAKQYVTQACHGKSYSLPPSCGMMTRNAPGSLCSKAWRNSSLITSICT